MNEKTLRLTIPFFEKKIFSTKLAIQIFNINYGRHLGHDSLISLLHESRIRFFKKFNYSEFDIEGLGILITSLGINYLNEAFYSDELTINIGTGHVSKTSCQLIYQAKIDEKKIADAFTTLTFYDYQQRRVAEIPPPFLSIISGNT